DQIRLTKAHADLSRLQRAIVCLDELTAAQQALRSRQQKVSLFDAVSRMKLDESLRAAQPAAPPARLSAGHEAEPEPKGGVRWAAPPPRARRDSRAGWCKACPRRARSDRPTRRADADPRRRVGFAHRRPSTPQRRRSTRNGRSSRARAAEAENVPLPSARWWIQC